MNTPRNSAPEQGLKSDWGGLPDQTVEAIKSAVAQGISRGIHDAFDDEDLTTLFFERAFSQMQRRAQAASGRWLLDSVGGLFRKVALFVVLGIVIYMAGGWGALVFWIKGGAPGGH